MCDQQIMYERLRCSSDIILHVLVGSTQKNLEVRQVFWDVCCLIVDYESHRTSIMGPGKRRQPHAQGASSLVYPVVSTL